MPNHAVCKHCKQSVRHHHKTLAVKNHLKKCKPFKRIMLDTAVVDRPDWWNDKNDKKSKDVTSSQSTSSSKGSSELHSQPSARSFAVPLFKASEQKKFNHEMAMHFYNTGTSFQRVDDPFLLWAIQIARQQMIVLGASLKSVMERLSLKWISSCQVTATMSALHPMHGRIYPMNQSSIIWLCLLTTPCFWKQLTLRSKDTTLTGFPKI